MGEFFGSIYCWFEDVFGLELANYLWGNVSPDQQANMYVPIGFTMLGATLVVCLLYYYIIDHPRMAKWWGWLVAENGGYPPTQNGDIRSLFWLFSLMALQN